MNLGNRKKKIAGWALIIAVGMLIMPPWVYTKESAYGGRILDVREDAGYDFILDPPSHRSPVIDWGRLAVQIAIVAGIAGIAILKGKKDECDTTLS